MKAIITLAVLIAVSGCNAGRNHYQEREIQRSMERSEKLAEKKQQCFEARELAKSNRQTEYEKCLSAVLLDVYTQEGKDVDLIELFISKRMLIASRLDSGKITDHEASVEYNELAVKMADEQNRRNTERMQRARNHGHEARQYRRQRNKITTCDTSPITGQITCNTY